MNYKLSVAERIVLLNTLPKEGSFSNLKLLRETREALSFTEEENVALGVKQDNGRVTWKEGTVEDKDIAIGVTVSKLIQDELRKLDRGQKLTENHMTLYEKFVQAEEKENG